MVTRVPPKFLFDYIPTSKPKVLSTRGGTSFWVTAGNGGVRSSILTVPVTFPPEQVNNGELGVQVQEDPQTTGASAIYHLSPAFQVNDARPGDGYGVGHRRAEEAGRLDHPPGRCPSFHADVRMLDPGGRWRTVRVPFKGPLPGSASEPR